MIGTAADVVDCRYNEMADEEVWGSVSILLANLVENLRTHMCTHPICLEVFFAVAWKCSSLARPIVQEYFREIGTVILSVRMFFCLFALPDYNVLGTLQVPVGSVCRPVREKSSTDQRIGSHPNNTTTRLTGDCNVYLTDCCDVRTASCRPLFSLVKWKPARDRHEYLNLWGCSCLFYQPERLGRA